MKYRLTIRSASGKPFTRDFDCEKVEFSGWWAILRADAYDEYGELMVSDAVVAAASSEHLLCIEKLEP